MKQFNLNEYLANPSRKVVTRDGRQVRILCTNANCNHPIVALIKEEDNTELTFNFGQDGLFSSGEECNVDLFFDIEIKHGWVNLYRTEQGFIIFGSVFNIKQDAFDELEKVNNCKYIDTIQIEWEEQS